ncbi:response regulator [Huintestinicola butyrica]|uniref:response regulator n=1 Tax=Huintestinicola butyrica TaxID=2981728 RepID=UPI003F7F51CC
MDIMMPRLNGYEATKQICSLKNRPDAVTILIISMTANAFVEDIQASLDSGMNAHIAKPLVMEEVIKVISVNLN